MTGRLLTAVPVTAIVLARQSASRAQRAIVPDVTSDFPRCTLSRSGKYRAHPCFFDRPQPQVAPTQAAAFILSCVLAARSRDSRLNLRRSTTSYEPSQKWSWRDSTGHVRRKRGLAAAFTVADARHIVEQLHNKRLMNSDTHCGRSGFAEAPHRGMRKFPDGLAAELRKDRPEISRWSCIANADQSYPPAPLRSSSDQPP
jgi:hypothetical protein